MSDISEPGIYPNIPFADYQRIPLLNTSTLKHALHSAKHLKAALDGEFADEDSPDRRLGRALHHRLLEPATYAERFPTSTRCCAILKNEGQCSHQGTRLHNGAWFCGQHDKDASHTPEDYVTQDEAGRVEGVYKAVMSSDVAGFLRSSKGSEVTLIQDLEGVRMKFRLDKFIPEIKLGGEWQRRYGDNCCGIVDLKKKRAGTCDHRSCQADAAKYHYGVQAAAYRMAAEKLTGRRCVFFLVFFEDAAPFDVLPILQTEDDHENGRNDFIQAINTYKIGTKLNQWPGVARGVEEGILPAWKLKQYAGGFA